MAEINGLKLNKTVLVSIVLLTGLIEVPVNRWTKRAACTVDGQQSLILFTYLAFFNKGAEAANAVSRSLLDGCRGQSPGLCVVAQQGGLRVRHAFFPNFNASVIIRHLRRR